MYERKGIRGFILLIGVVVLASSCQGDRDIDASDLLDGSGEISALPTEVIAPNDNRFSEEKYELGRVLFWDPILSGTKTVACATCHHPDFGYADGRELSSGVNGSGLGPGRLDGGIVKRNAPTIINTGFNGIQTDGSYDPTRAVMFWDNRTESLERQALEPLLSDTEMRGEVIAEHDIIDTVVLRIQSVPEYRNLFADAFGDDNVTAIRIAQSLATFQRNVLANNSRFDLYARGDEDALSNNEVQGMNAFIDVGCADCHNGPMFSNYELHTLSVPNHRLVEDRGANGNFEFRTPTLRNLGLTAPYMHNGRFDDLRDVLEFYDDISRRNGDSQNPFISDNDIDRDARQLDLNNRQINSIIAFLNTLNDNDFDKAVPQSVPSGLSVGGDI